MDNINDVLSGKGNATTLYSGNIIFSRKQEAYSRLSHDEEEQKTAEELIGQITSNEGEGRFLSKIDDDGLCRPLDLKEMKRETTQDLKEESLRNNVTVENKISTPQNFTLATDHNLLREHPRINDSINGLICNPQQEIDMDPTDDLQFSMNFDWETLDNDNDSSLHNIEAIMSSISNGDDSLDDIETVIPSVSIDALSGLHSAYQGHRNKNFIMRDVSGEVKNDGQAQKSIVTNTNTNQKDACGQPTSSPIITLNRSGPYFTGNQEAKYGDQNHFTNKIPIDFSDEHDSVHDKSNEQCLSSQTKHTDSRNEARVKKRKEEPCFTTPNSSHSDIPLKYVTLMRDPILSWMPQRNLVSNEDEDDEPNNSTHREQPRNNVATNDQVWSTPQDINLNQTHYHHYLTPTPFTKHTNSRYEGRVKKTRLSHIQPKVRGEVYIETETSRRECQSVQCHPTRLSMPNDEAELNSLHCFVRRELLELFFYRKGHTIVAQSLTDLTHNNSENDCGNTKNDTSTSRRNDLIMPTFNASPLTNNDVWNDSLRVGFRCVYCAHLHQMPSDDSSQNTNGMNAFYPKSLAHIYRLVCKWQRVHFRKCKHIPLSTKKKYEHLKSSDKTRGRTSYWVSSAIELGLVDDTKPRGGIRYHATIRGKDC